MTPQITNEEKIAKILSGCQNASKARIHEVLDKAAALKGLTLEETAVLSQAQEQEELERLFQTAARVKETIYGRRLVIFAPLYISNLCNNECLYCAFRAANKKINRRALSRQEISAETRYLIDQGHKRILLVAGESYPQKGFQYVLDSIKTVYDTRSENGEIRRVNVNVAPLNPAEFRELKKANIGTYQLFQETYHRQTYASVHVRGPKTDYDNRLTAPDRAMEAGIDDLGIGILFGLYDWRFELLALMQHIGHLETKYGVGPHTISVPRLEPATGSDISLEPPWPLTDTDFKKLVAILRLAVPYTGIIMSTRETAKMRRDTFSLGVSQISAGSRTNPGGYSADNNGAASKGRDGYREPESAQFSLGDHRPLDEVIGDVAGMGYLPSFCTGCYRLGRTGGDFMDLAKPGDIKAHCEPNGVSTFQEYLCDYASAETVAVGEKLIKQALTEMPPPVRAKAQAMLEKVKSGQHDVFC
jgi:2-iminoacetate synthase